MPKRNQIRARRPVRKRPETHEEPTTHEEPRPESSRFGQRIPVRFPHSPAIAPRIATLFLLFLSFLVTSASSLGAGPHGINALPQPVGASAQPVAATAPFPQNSVLRRPRPGELWPLPQPLWCVLSTPDENLVPSPETPGPRPGGTSPECLPPSTPGENFSALPPSLGEITNYFKEALGEAPNPEDKYCLRFERCLPFRWGPSWRRLLLKVSPSDAHSLTLEWWTNDDFGLSELREFFEAPFFHPSESKRFYRWLSEQGWHAAPFRDRHLLMGVLEQGGMVYVQIRWWRGLKNAHSPPF